MHCFLDVTSVTEAHLDLKRRSLSGTAPTNLTLQSVMRTVKPKTQTTRVEVSSIDKEMRESPKLQAPISPAAAPSSLTSPSFVLSPFILVPTPTKAPSALISPSYVLSPFILVPTPTKAPSVLISLPYRFPNTFPDEIAPAPSPLVVTYPTVKYPIVAYPSTLSSAAPTVAFGVLNVLQVNFDCLMVCLLPRFLLRCITAVDIGTQQSTGGMHFISSFVIDVR